MSWPRPATTPPSTLFRADWGAEDGDVTAGEHGVDGGDELGVAVADQEPELLGAVAEVHQ